MPAFRAIGGGAEVVLPVIPVFDIVVIRAQPLVLEISDEILKLTSIAMDTRLLLLSFKLYE